MRYVSNRKELVEEGDWDYTERLSFTQLLQLLNPKYQVNLLFSPCMMNYLSLTEKKLLIS